jgi:MinD-like ATPase involved in chromosome partitioning or flagellar assembly
VDLPTYTNIWRIEKRLYKLYDLRLPMPLPLVQIGVFVGVFLPWIILLQLVGLPFHAPWHVVYLVPPGLLTWLATRPVIEGKRLTELLISQVRYLTEARTWARLTPIREPGEVIIVGRVWRRGRLSGDRVHAAGPAAHPAPLTTAAEHAAVAAATVPPALEHAGTGAGQAYPGAARRPGTAQRPQPPSLQPTPHDGTTVVPSAPSGGRLTPARVEPTRPQPVRAEPSSRPVPGRPVRAQPTAPQAVPGLPASPGTPATPATSASPGTIPRRGTPAGLPARPGLPAVPAADTTGPASPEGEAADRRVAERGRPADKRPDTAPQGPGRETEAQRRVTRQRNISHEPEAPTAGSRPTAPPTLGRPSEPPAAKPAGPVLPARPDAPVRADAPAKPAGTGPVGRHAAPPRPPAHPDGSPASPPGGAGTRWPDGSTPAQPPATGRSAQPVETGQPGAPAASGRPAGPGQADEGALPGSAIPLPQGRHAKPADESTAPRSAEPPTENGDPARRAGQRPTEAAADRGTANAGAAADRPRAADGGAAADRGAAAPSDEEQSIAEARTDQIVWPTPPRRNPPPRPDAAATPPRDTPAGRPARPATPSRGRSHGEETMPAREARPAAWEAQPTAPGWTPPSPARPATPPVPPRAAAAGYPSAPAVPPQAPSSQPPAQPPAQPPRTQPARPAQIPAARSARPPAPPRQATEPPQSRPDGGAPPESPARAVRSGPASPVRPGPMPQVGHDDEARGDDARGRRRIFSGGGDGEADYEQRVRTAFAGARRVVVLGCTGGAGQTVTALMLGHTFAQHRGDRIVAVDVNPGPGAMARRTRTETRETLTSLITHAEQVTGYQMMRRYTSISKSGLEVVAAGKNPVQALDDRDYALAMRTLDRFYSITLLDAAAAVVARVLPYADQIVLVAPASSDAPRAVAMTFEWLDGHGYEDLRARAVTVINGVSRRSMDDVEQAESVARGRCRALVRIPWDDHLSLDRAPRNELRSLRAPTRKAYIALGGVVAGGLIQTPGRYPQQEVSR